MNPNDLPWRDAFPGLVDVTQTLAYVPTPRGCSSADDFRKAITRCVELAEGSAGIDAMRKFVQSGLDHTDIVLFCAPLIEDEAQRNAALGYVATMADFGQRYGVAAQPQRGPIASFGHTLQQIARGYMEETDRQHRRTSSETAAMLEDVASELKRRRQREAELLAALNETVTRLEGGSFG